MRRIGMTRDPAEDFLDPTVPEGPLRPNAVYRIKADSAEVGDRAEVGG